MQKADEMLAIINHKLINLKVAIDNNKKNLAKLQFAMIEYDLNKLKELVLGEDHPSK